MLNWRSKWLSVIHSTSHTTFCPPINCLSEPKNTRRSILGQTNSLSSSAPCLQSFELGFLTSYYMGLWDSVEACSICSTHIWCGSTSQKINNGTSSWPRQCTITSHDFFPEHSTVGSNVPLWDFLEQSQCPCIYQRSVDRPSSSGSSCFRSHISF